MAKTALAPGQVEEVTTRSRILSPTEANNTEKEKPHVEFWDYIARLTPDQWKDHVIYVYRGPMKGGKYIAKYMQAITPDFIVENHGGGDYNFILNRKYEMIAREEFSAEGVPLTASQPPLTTDLGGGMNETIALILQRQNEMFERVLDRLSGGDTASMVRSAATSGQEIMKDAFRNAVATVQPAAPQPSRSDAILDKLLTIALEKLTNPADPIDTFSKMATAMQPFIAKQSGGSSSVAVELMKNAPSLVHEISEGLKNIAAIQHNQINAQLLARGGPVPPQHLPPQPAVATVPTQASTQPTSGPQIVETPAPQTPAAPAKQPWQDLMEYQITNILLDQTVPTDDQVSEVLTIMDAISPQIAEAICKEGEKGVMALMDSSAHLGRVPRGPRLTEFITKFLAAVGSKGALLVPDPPPSA